MEQASADMEAARMVAIGKLDAPQLFALAAREFAGKIDRIDALTVTVTVTPDMVSGLMRQLGFAQGLKQRPKG